MSGGVERHCLGINSREAWAKAALGGPRTHQHAVVWGECQVLDASVLAVPAAHNILDNLASLDKIHVPATMTPASNERYRKVTSRQVPPPGRACCLEAVSSVMSCLAPETLH